MTHLATAVRRRFAAVLLFAALGASCSNDSLTAPTSPSQLDGTWRLSQMTSGGVVHNEDLNAGRFNVTFSAEILNAKADCNVCTGLSTLSGDTLAVPPLACTRASCASTPLDTQFSGMLVGVHTVRINERLLQLNSPSGELRFEK